jgi:hypothetical protein
MFAKFHGWIRLKTNFETSLVNLGGNAVGFSAKLEDLVLKSTSASEIRQNEKQKEFSPKSKEMNSPTC